MTPSTTTTTPLLLLHTQLLLLIVNKATNIADHIIPTMNNIAPSADMYNASISLFSPLDM